MSEKCTSIILMHVPITDILLLNLFKNTPRTHEWKSSGWMDWTCKAPW